MTIGSRIKAARKAKKLSQPELADLCGWGLNQGRISHYEKGRRQVSIPDAVIIAAALGTNIVDLLGPHLVSSVTGDTVDELMEQFQASGDIGLLLAALPYDEKVALAKSLLVDVNPKDAVELAQALLKHTQDAL